MRGWRLGLGVLTSKNVKRCLESKGMLHVDVCGAGRQDPKEGWGCELEETIDQTDQTDQTIGNCRFVSSHQWQ
jgi:hypothetical protein